MSKIKEGTRVVSIENGALRKGTVKNVYEDLGYAVVNFGDGELVKKILKDLAVEPEPVEAEETTGEKTESKPVVKSEITITPDEFKHTASVLSADLCFTYGPENMYILAKLCSRLHVALFVESEND